MNKKRLLLLALGAILVLSSLTGCTTTEEKPTLIFADLSWDSVQVHNRIVAFIAENGYGYETDYIPGETSILWGGLRRGDVNINMESWTENIQKIYDEGIAAGDVVDLGSNYPDSWQGWLVPTYMIEDGLLPEGITVDQMAEYWDLFEDPEDPTKGRFINSIPGWLCTEINTNKLEAYGLDEYYTDFLAGSDAALSGSMVAAYEKHESWFGYYWSPTWVLGKLDKTPIEEPAYDESLWGTTYGCAFPPTHVNIIVNAELLDTAPDIVDFLRNYETTAEINNQFLAYMQDTGGTTEDAAIWFLQNYESLWTQWLPSDVVSEVKAALP